MIFRVKQNGDGYDETIGWISANDSGLTNGLDITDDYKVKIFQDDFKNLWIIWRNQKLQVLKANQNGDGYVNSWQKPID